MSRKLTNEEFLYQVQQLTGDEYTFLDGYTNAVTKMKARHNLCGTEYYITPNGFKTGSRCPVCAEKIRAKSKMIKHSDIEEMVHTLGGGEYVMLEKYQGCHTPMYVKHIKCGHRYKVKPNNFKYGRRCPKCMQTKRVISNTRKHEDFEKLVLEKGSGEYECVTRYTKNMEPVTLRHIPCGYVYTSKATNFLQGTRCPKCNASRGETYVYNILTQNSVKFETEYRFNDCKNKRPLPFDFAVFDGDDVYLVIEYHGKQHYYPNDFFGGEEAFKGVRERDAIKEAYCKKNNIVYLELPYALTDVQIEESILMALLQRKTKPKCVEKVGVTCG